jgi:6-phosphogluconolactonase
MGSGLKQELYETANIAGLCRRAAELIIAAGRAAIDKRGCFTLVLTGGGTVQALYKYLVAISSAAELREIWHRTDFFLGDERWVPEDHPDSNGGMVRRLLLEPLGISADRIFLMPTGLDSPEDNAADYERTLRNFFAKGVVAESNLPEFDLVLLGMGSDGHVASLFPGTAALQERVRLVTTSFPPLLAPAVERITLTMPVINRAREVVILVSGAAKKVIARRIMADPLSAAKLYPAGLVEPSVRKGWVLAEE